jgi:hypothetical protein
MDDWVGSGAFETDQVEFSGWDGKQAWIFRDGAVRNAQARDEQGRFAAGGGSQSASRGPGPNGEWYHGSRRDWDEIGGKKQAFGGIHLGTERAAEERLNNTPSGFVHGRPGAEKIHSVMVSLKKPFNSPKNPMSEHDMFLLVNDPGELKKVTEKHDGAFYRNNIEDPGSVSVAVFDKDSLKHVDVRKHEYGTTSNALVNVGGGTVLKRHGETGTRPPTSLGKSHAVSNVRWAFHTTSEQVQAFKQWLKEQLSSLIEGKTQQDLWSLYIQQGYKKGAGRAFADAMASEKFQATSQEQLDFYAGSREQFLRSAFAQPVSVDRVKQLAGRAFDDLKNITADMSTRMSRVLLDGLVQGQSPRKVARTLAKEVDLGAKRALVISRTELIRAHAEGQLDGFDHLGIEKVGAQVEWLTSGMGVTAKGNPSPCEDCEELEGQTFTIAEARGMLPLHPN